MRRRIPGDGLWFVWSGSAIALGQFGNSLLVPALPRLAQDFAIPVQHSSLAITLYFAMFALGSLIAGPLSDRYGRRLPLLAGLSLSILACVAVALSATFTLLLLARAVQAVGAAGTPVIARAMARDKLAGTRLTHLLGLLTLAMAVSPVLGPIIGGYVVAHADWRVGFLGLGLAGLTIAILGLVMLDETLDAHAKKPLSLLPIGAFRAVFANASFRAGSGALMLYFTMIGAVYVGSPFVFIEHYGLSSIAFGYCFAGFTLTISLGSITVAWLKRRLGDRVVARLSAELAVLAGLIWVKCALLPDPQVLLASGGLALLGLALGWILPVATTYALADTGSRAGAASSLLGFMQIGASAVGSALLGAIHSGTEWPLAIGLLLLGLCAWSGAGRFAERA